MSAYEGTILGYLTNEPDNTRVNTNFNPPTLPQPQVPTLHENIPIPDNTSAVSLIDSLLGARYKQNRLGASLTEMQQDALRHYYGMRSLAGSYGPTTANIMGHLNEWSPVDLLSGYAGGPEQAEIDLSNNAVALDHVNRGVGLDFHHDLNMDSLRNVLKHLTIPPKPKYMR